MKAFGLIGESLGHSLSPLIHQKIYKHIGLDATYSLFQVKPDMLRAAAEGLRALDIQGANVTIPYKVQLMDCLDEISPEARKIGAINTILNKSSYLTGYNTDYTGFGRMLCKYSIDISGGSAVILGSGGAAKAVAAYLEAAGIGELSIVTRSSERPAGFGQGCSFISYKDIHMLSHKNLLVNCTPVGMYPKVDAAPLTVEQCSKFDAIVDLIYNPSDTLLMKQAKSIGVPAYNGLYMLVSQAVAAVEIWNDITIPDNIVDIVYEEILTHL